ncbi:MAG: alpha/beta hydrolase [Dehalococcoidia bacterium]
MQREVSFYSDGLKIAGIYYVPDGLQAGERRPAIVCLHGYSGLKDAYLLPVPERLSELGYVALAIDHRGFGKSEGTRGKLQPFGQGQDTMDAITFLELQPEVMPERIGLYGTSFGGGTVAWVAGTDRRARCAVSVVPVACGERWLRSLRAHGQWLEFLQLVEEERRQRVVSGQSRRVGLGELMPSDAHGTRAIAELYRPEERLPEGYPLENIEATIAWCPEERAHLISPRPILVIGCQRDGVAPVVEAESLYDKAREPKKLVIIPDAYHHDVYKAMNPHVFEVTMKETAAWYGQHL